MSADHHAEEMSSIESLAKGSWMVFKSPFMLVGEIASGVKTLAANVMSMFSMPPSIAHAPAVNDNAHQHVANDNAHPVAANDNAHPPAADHPEKEHEHKPIAANDNAHPEPAHAETHDHKHEGNHISEATHEHPKEAHDHKADAHHDQAHKTHDAKHPENHSKKRGFFGRIWDTMKKPYVWAKEKAKSLASAGKSVLSMNATLWETIGGGLSSYTGGLVRKIFPQSHHGHHGGHHAAAHDNAGHGHDTHAANDKNEKHDDHKHAETA